eukprot:m.208934 g.208934  ORF g.208934 m.208934 type:complete len:1338 (+) comp16934_c0_seq2:374-4387(+)
MDPTIGNPKLPCFLSPDAFSPSLPLETLFPEMMMFNHFDQDTTSQPLQSDISFLKISQINNDNTSSARHHRHQPLLDLQQQLKQQQSPARGSHGATSTQLSQSPRRQPEDLSAIKFKTKALLKQGKKASPLLRPIFSRDQGSSQGTPAGDAFREGVCLFLMQLIEDPDMHTTLCSDLLDVLMIGIDALNGDGLTAVCMKMLLCFQSPGSVADPPTPSASPSPSNRRNSVAALASPSSKHGTGKVFELLPKALSRLETLDSLSGQLETGNAFKSFFLNRLCNLAWPTHCILPIADAFKMVNFSEDQSKFAFSKLVRSLQDLAPEEVPPLVYQLLLLSGKGHRQVILKGIISFCTEQSNAAANGDDRYRSSVMQTQGTVLMHISFAVKQDQELGKELLKIIRGDSELSSFTVAAALCLLSVPRFEQNVQTVFKTILSKYETSSQRLCRAVWLAPYRQLCIDPQHVFSAVVDNTGEGWDYITAPLLRLALFFLDSSKMKEGETLQVRIACDVLDKSFGMHPSVRAFVIDEIISRIITRSSPNSEAYLELFSRIIQNHVLSLKQYAEKLRDVLDYLVFLPAQQSVAILKALMPLVAASDRLHEAAMLVLRKALFNRSLDARLMAVHGFFELLEHFDDPALWSEICTSLRRCFSQQLEVRALLYEKCVRVAPNRSALAPVLADLLDHQRTHLMPKAMTSTSSGPPFSMATVVLDKVETNHQADSIGGLLNAMHSLSQFYETLETHVHFKPFLSSFVDRLIKSDLEDFEIDKAADFSDASGPPSRNLAAAYVLIEAYDACLNILSQEDLTLERCQQLVTIIRKRQSISDMLKEGHRKRKDTDRCLVSSTCLITLLNFILISDDADQAASRAILTSKVHLVRFLLEACQHYMTKEPTSTGACQLTSILLRESARSVDRSPLRKLYEDRKNKGRQLRHLCFQQVLSNLREHAKAEPTKRMEYLTQLTNELNEEEEWQNGNSPQIRSQALMLSWAERAVASCLRDVEDMKIIPTLIEMCVLLVTSFSQNDISLAAKLHTFLYKLCESGKDIEDMAVVKAACQQLLEADNYGDVALKLTADCQVYLGCLEEEEDEHPSQELHFTIMSKKVCESSVIPLLIMEDVEKRIDDLIFALEQLTHLVKISKTGITQDTEASQSELPNDEPIYDRLLKIMRITDELLQTVLEKKPTWNRLFKTCRRLYDTLSNACKLMLLYFQTHKDVHVPDIFQKIVHFSSKSLSQHVYTAINFVNEDAELNNAKKLSSADAKLIPNLVYAIEQYEKFIIMVEKKAHLNLLKHMKRSTARDFRISAQAVQEAMASVTENASNTTAKRNQRESATASKLAKRE